MNNISRILIAAAAFSVMGAGAFAQGLKPNMEPSETITVVAPYLVMEKEAKSAPHQKLMQVSYLGTASFGDLDLSKAEGASKLKDRVHDTASELCKQIEAKYPSTVYVPVTNQDCVKAAVQDAMVAVDVLIAAYHRG